MNTTLSSERKKRRESIKGASRIEYGGPLTKEVIEDFVAAAPNVQILYIDLLDDTIFNISDLRQLKDLVVITIKEGYELNQIKLNDIQDLDALIAIEFNCTPEVTIEEIDLAPLENHPELTVLTIACPVKNLKGLDTLNTIPKLNSIGLYNLDIPELNLSSLKSCKNLESIYLGDLGTEVPTEPYRITLPKEAPIKIFEVAECYSENLLVEMDYTFLEGKDSLDSFALINCNLTSFDLTNLSSLKRIGKIDLSNNKISHLDITPILEMPMFTEKALGEPPFVIDEDVVIRITKSREQDIIDIISRSDRVVEDHDGSFAIEYEFGHEWLKNLIESHTVEWV
jgi:hypothetical protein